MSENKIFRIHPAIGIARVGTSNEHFIGPETMAGMDGENGAPAGGLPIKDGHETQTITSNDLRDSEGRLKKQGARFKIFEYTDEQVGTYPSGGGKEIIVGSKIGDLTVASILWEVHLANKKANSWNEPSQGIAAYDSLGGCTSSTPEFRNPKFTNTEVVEVESEDKIVCNSHDILNETNRLTELVIDAGPHVVAKGIMETASFSSTAKNSTIGAIPILCGDKSYTTGPVPVDYPKLFPTYPSEVPENENINSLGDMHTDDKGRLVVVAAEGKASGFKYLNKDELTGVTTTTGKATYDSCAALDESVNNDNWFDDIGDGPVTAVLLMSDNTTLEVQGSAWVVTSDPSYAPQIPNVVSLWEDVYNTWVEEFALEPSLYTPKIEKEPKSEENEFYLGVGYKENYRPDFENQIKPMLNAAKLQRFTTNLVPTGQGAHIEVGKSTPKQPGVPTLMSFLRNPNIDNNKNSQNKTRMPLSLGDSDEDFLNFSRTQYFFMYQWLKNGIYKEDTNEHGKGGRLPLGPGELLDRNILGNCLGGRFSPGIEMTFIVRDKKLYKDWNKPENKAGGPFRMNMKKIDYKNFTGPVLGVGYTPLKNDAVEPGDISKFMSIPWHTDYNSCATHTNDGGSMTYWSWPAQRPVAVYTYDDLACSNGELKTQRFSVRGEGTNAYYLPNTELKKLEKLDDSKNRCEYTGKIEVYKENTVSERVGRYQYIRAFLDNWHRVGTVIQGTSIDVTDEVNYSKEILREFFLEVQSQFEEDDSNVVVPGPIAKNHAVGKPAAKCPHNRGK